MSTGYYHNDTVSVPAYGHCAAWSQMQHDGQHVIFYGSLPVQQIERVLTLDSACERANAWLRSGQLFEPGAHSNEVANLVRINLCYHSLQELGNVKPMLMQYPGQWPLRAATGGTRMAALELLPEIETVSCFVSTHSRWRSVWQHCEEVTSWVRFCELASADAHGTVVLRLTDTQADYGLDWYEVEVDRVQVPQDDRCLTALRRYLGDQSSNFEFCPEWFRLRIDWAL